MNASQIVDDSASPSDSVEARELTLDELELVAGGRPLVGCTFMRTFVWITPQTDYDGDCAD